MKKQLLDERGAVSLISVSIFAIIITIITTLYMRTVSSQQRNALDYDMKTRAFYATLVGFEDTKRSIYSGDLTEDKDGCSPEDDDQEALTKLNLRYTCQLVTFNATEQEHTAILPDVESRLFTLSPAEATSGTDYTLNITWSGADGDTTARSGDDYRLLPPVSDWGDNTPPMLRAQIIRTDLGLHRDSMRSRSYFFNPEEAGESAPSLNFQDDDWTPTNRSLRGASCNSEGTCQARVSLRNVDFNSRRAFLVVKSVYKAIDSIQVSLEDGSGEPIALSGQAFIDITAKSGDVFRRTRQGIGVGSIPVRTINFPDFSIVGGNGICKEMSLTNNVNQFERGSCTP